MSNKLTKSRIHMWRAVVAMVHADGVVTPQEISFINEHIENPDFPFAEQGCLSEDLKVPKDVYEMFSKITNMQDKQDFFTLARALSWCDGDYNAQEREIVQHLEVFHEKDENRNLFRETRNILTELELGWNQWIAVNAANTRSAGALRKVSAA